METFLILCYYYLVGIPVNIILLGIYCIVFHYANLRREILGLQKIEPPRSIWGVGCFGLVWPGAYLALTLSIIHQLFDYLITKAILDNNKALVVTHPNSQIRGLCNQSFRNRIKQIIVKFNRLING